MSFAGVTDLKLLVKRSRSYINDEIVEKQIGKDKKSLQARSPVNFAEDISIPVLLIHGSKDRVVRVEQSRKMHKQLKKVGKNVEYVELKGGNHYLSKEDDRLKTFRAMETFLDKHLGTKAL